MKQFVWLAAAVLGLSGLALAETFNGTLIDVMCKDKAAADHTRKCAIGCSKSGYGLMTSDGKFLKFNDAGNAKALAALKASSKEKDLKATVTGTQNGDVLDVQSVTID